MKRIEIDYSATAGTNTRFEALCVGAGRAAELLRQGALDHLREVHKEAGFQYLRFHGLLHDEMAVYKVVDDKPVYNFMYVDLVYDAILEAGMKPFVELGFMPTAMASGDRTVFWWKANVTPPTDYAAWGALIKALTEHLERRYGRDEIKTWFFEVWNEPNHPGFFTGTMDDYFHLYQVSAEAIKSVCPDYRVGGPSTAGSAWVPELIQFCTDNHVALDFITTHSYGVDMHLDEFGTKLHKHQQGKDVIGRKVRNVADQIKTSPMPQLPLHYTEWSASCSSRDPVHDAYLSAAYILDSLAGSDGAADSMSYWTYTDVFEEGGPPPSPFHGGFGMINLQGLRKPSFYAYQFLHRLGPERLACDDKEVRATRSEKGVQLLVWNYASPDAQEEANQTYFKRDLKPAPLGDTQCSVTHLPDGEYRLTVYGVGYRRNDVYTDFLDMGSPQHMTREEVAALAERNNGAPLLEDTVQITDGTFRHTLEMRENDIFLILLERRDRH